MDQKLGLIIELKMENRLPSSLAGLISDRVIFSVLFFISKPPLNQGDPEPSIILAFFISRSIISISYLIK